MDERIEEQQVDDLEIEEQDAEDVKGGAWYAKFDGVDGSVKAADGSVRPGGLKAPGGVEHQHNETLVRI